MGKRHIFAFCVIATYMYLVNSYDVVQLETDNTITLRGNINQYASSYVIDKLIELNQTLEVNRDIYLYINSGGGNVAYGLEIINIIQTINVHRNVTCIANYAGSMAFVIFQTCANRYITPHATLMQHQPSVTINNMPLENAMTYLQFVIDRNILINAIQANRIGMDVTKFSDKIIHDWFIYGDDNIKNNTADKIVYIVCSSELIKSTVKVNNLEFSACPLIIKSKSTENNNENEEYDFSPEFEF